MASRVGILVAEMNKKPNIISPKNLKKPWSPNSSTCGHGDGHQAPPMCVCAPPTHAGSFKCRLHRTNSHGHSPQSPTMNHQPSAQAPASKTVEAQ